MAIKVAGSGVPGSVPVKTNPQPDGEHVPVYDFNTDSANFDAFSRLRTSETGNRLDVEFHYNKQPDYFDEITSSGTVTFNGNSKDLTLSLSNANDGSHATMRSHPVPYTPGNSQLVDITGVLDLAAIGTGSAELFLRSKVTGSVVDEAIPQEDWTNASTGVDWAQSHILMMDFQSLKVGRIRFLLNQNGLPVYLGEINNDNERNTGFWQLASLQAYWRIYNDATNTYMEMGYGDENNAIGIRYTIAANASATMKAICCTVKSEGGKRLSDMTGLPRCADNGVTKITVSTTLIPLLSIRPQSTYETYDNLVISLLKGFAIETDNPIRLVVFHNATLTNESWVSVTDSCMEYDVSATAITGGHGITADYISTAKNTESSGQGLLGKTVIWNRKGSETGIISIAAVKTGATDASCLAALRWEELR